MNMIEPDILPCVAGTVYCVRRKSNLKYSAGHYWSTFDFDRPQKFYKTLGQARQALTRFSTEGYGHLPPEDLQIITFELTTIDVQSYQPKKKRDD